MGTEQSLSILYAWDGTSCRFKKIQFAVENKQMYFIYNILNIHMSAIFSLPHSRDKT